MGILNSAHAAKIMAGQLPGDLPDLEAVVSTPFTLQLVIPPQESFADGNVRLVAKSEIVGTEVKIAGTDGSILRLSRPAVFRFEYLPVGHAQKPDWLVSVLVNGQEQPYAEEWTVPKGALLPSGCKSNFRLSSHNNFLFYWNPK